MDSCASRNVPSPAEMTQIPAPACTNYLRTSLKLTMVCTARHPPVIISHPIKAHQELSLSAMWKLHGWSAQAGEGKWDTLYQSDPSERHNMLQTFSKTAFMEPTLLSKTPVLGNITRLRTDAKLLKVRVRCRRILIQRIVSRAWGSKSA